MSPVIEIATQAIDTRRITSKKSGEVFVFHEQPAYMHKKGEPYPEKCSIRVNENEAGIPVAYPNGKYTLGEESFYVDRYGAISCRPVLIRIADKPQSAPAPTRAAG